ncbi:MAG: DNA adenine methylase, partial [Caldilineaceae bacterium]|nr:DNA adenine methylase [Caldilineaceae bacterium]
MQQLSWLEQEEKKRIVNVASVPQRSPFRYPGGKTWLVPKLRAWLRSLSARPVEFVEPFAGGGIISLTVAFERLAEHVTMVELDAQVAAVWKTILAGDAAWLAHQITSFQMTLETLDAVLAKTPVSTQELALQTTLKNRTYRGGILAPGAGKIRYGEKGRGILSRWYPETISRRILEIARPEIRSRITFVEGDGLAIARQKAASPTTVFFIDPPYTASTKRAGSRLYLHSALDHAELFRIAATFAGDFLMTYDDAEELRDLAAQHGFDTELVAMKNT